MSSMLEKIARYVLLAGLAFLLFRNTSFVLTGIPKPFEACFMVAWLLVIVDLSHRRAWGAFFGSIPKKIWIAATVLVSSVAIGWLMAVFFRHLPSTMNMVYEFVAFIVAASTGILVLYFSRDNTTYIRYCMYALCVPALYFFAPLAPSIALKMGIAEGGTFHGFTDNVNIVSKAILIPLMVASAYALVAQVRTWQRIVAAALAALLFALVLWTSQRAAILAFIAASAGVWAVLAYIQRDWRKMFLQAGILLLIALVGFIVVPNEGKKAVLDRILNLDGNQSGYEKIKDKTVAEIIETSIQKDQGVSAATFASEKTPEPRILMWKEYGKITLHNPLGLGPNTHMPVTIHSTRVTFQNPGPHNTYLEMWLWGGIAGIAALLYLIYIGFSSLIRTLRTAVSFEPVAVFGALSALSVALFFNDSLPYIWFWVVLAIAIRIWNPRV